MAINWIQVNRTALRSATIAERGDTEIATGRTSAAIAAAQYIFGAANSRSLDYRINSELARLETEAYRVIPAGSSDGMLVYVVISTATDGSSGVSASSFICAGLVGPPYHFSSSSRALHHFHGRSSILPSGAGTSSMRYFWGTRTIDVCI